MWVAFAAGAGEFVLAIWALFKPDKGAAFDPR
jgi:hypothetical protein